VGPLQHNPLALVVPQVILLLPHHHPHQALVQVIAQAVVAVSVLHPLLVGNLLAHTTSIGVLAGQIRTPMTMKDMRNLGSITMKLTLLMDGPILMDIPIMYQVIMQNGQYALMSSVHQLNKFVGL